MSRYVDPGSYDIDPGRRKHFTPPFYSKGYAPGSYPAIVAGNGGAALNTAYGLLNDASSLDSRRSELELKAGEAQQAINDAEWDIQQLRYDTLEGTVNEMTTEQTKAQSMVASLLAVSKLPPLAIDAPDTATYIALVDQYCYYYIAGPGLFIPIPIF